MKKVGVKFLIVLSSVIYSTAIFSAPSKILFGSCSHQDKPMPIFDAINQEGADLFIFLGDNVYGDTEDMKVLENKYKKLGNNPGFSKLREETPTIAIWDDHDFGENDAGQEYAKKEESRKVMLDFWQESEDSPRRNRQDGIYTSYFYGEGEDLVQVIMPDLRWNRPALNKVSDLWYFLKSFVSTSGPYRPVEDPKASMLGESQWRWLEQELLKPAKIKIIASSLQLLPDFTGWESWANFPADRDRLLKFISDNRISGVLFISGDTHWGEMSKLVPGLGYPLWEVTSSGLTEEWKDVSPNVHRQGEAKPEVNYGFLDVDWKQPDPTIKFGLKDLHGKILMQQEFELSDLQFN